MGPVGCVIQKPGVINVGILLNKCKIAYLILNEFWYFTNMKSKCMCPM